MILRALYRGIIPSWHSSLLGKGPLAPWSHTSHGDIYATLRIVSLGLGGLAGVEEREIAADASCEDLGRQTRNGTAFLGTAAPPPPPE